MGVDTIIRFPVRTRLQTIGDALGILAGLPKEDMHSSHGDMVFLHVPGIKYRTMDIVPTMVTIELLGDMVDGCNGHSAYWHWEAADGPMLRLRPTPFWVAIALRLVDQFGGKLDIFDCDSQSEDYKMPKPSACRWDLDNDEYFWRMQRRLRFLEPVSEEFMLATARRWGLEYPEWSDRPAGVHLDIHGRVV